MSLLLHVSTNLVWADNLWRCHMEEMRKRDATVHVGSQKSPTPDSGVGLSFAAVHDFSPLLSCVRAADGVAHDRGNAGATGSFFWLNLLGLG